MKIIITRASDSSKRVEYEPEIVEKVDLKDIVTRYGRCESNEVINIIDADADRSNPDKSLLRQIGYDTSTRDYYQVIGYNHRIKIAM